MLVETYECQETAAEPIEATEEAVSIMESLGLSGQLGLVTKSETSGRDTRCPYQEMTADQMAVFSALCPEHVKLESYGRGPIPLRVLQVAAHAKSLDYFTSLWVWDKAKAEVKDPVLVGTIGRDYSPDKTYILARWGEELESWPVLVKAAIEQATKNVRAQLASIAQRIEQRKVAIEQPIDSITDDRLKMPSYYD